MLNHLDLYKILTALQHRLCNGICCEIQLLINIHDHMKYKDCKIQTDIIIILDISNTFDTVHHGKLLYSVRCLGIKPDIV